MTIIQTIASQLLRLDDALDDAISALATKGVTATGHGVEDLGNDIRSIQQGGNSFIVNLSYNSQQQKWVPDCTFAEAYDAYDSGKDIAFEAPNFKPVSWYYDDSADGFYYVVHPSFSKFIPTYCWGFNEFGYIWTNDGVEVDEDGTIYLNVSPTTAVETDVTFPKLFAKSNGSFAVGMGNTTKESIIPFTSTVAADWSNGDGYYYYNQGISPTDVAENDEYYIVEFDGVSYTCKGSYHPFDQGTVILGAPQNPDDYSDPVPIWGDYPFQASFYWSGPDGDEPDAQMLVQTSGAHTFKVDHVVAGGGGGNYQTKSVTPSETAQTITADAGYDALDQVNVGAISSSYVGSNVPRRDSDDLSASGGTVSVPAGYYASAASKAVASGTAGTPTATKGTVSNHAVTVTPKVVNTEGYISGGTETGTGVSVTASELVSDRLPISANGSYDVTNYEEVLVSIQGSSMNVQVAAGVDRVNTTSYTSVSGQSLTVAKTGTYDVYWTGFRSSTSGTNGSQLYIGNTAYGSAQTTFSNHGQAIHLTGVSLTQGQTITVRARARGTSYYMYVGNLTIVQTA